MAVLNSVKNKYNIKTVKEQAIVGYDDGAVFVVGAGIHWEEPTRVWNYPRQPPSGAGRVPLATDASHGLGGQSSYRVRQPETTHRAGPFQRHVAAVPDHGEHKAAAVEPAVEADPVGTDDACALRTPRRERLSDDVWAGAGEEPGISSAAG